MYKKSLLSYTTTAAIILFNIQFNAYAENLDVFQGQQKEVKDKTYEIIHAKDGGQITGKNITVIGNENTNKPIYGAVIGDLSKGNYAVTAESNNSKITLTGDKTKIQGKDNSIISLGVIAKDGAIFQMTGGNVTVSTAGTVFIGSESRENKLENVTISSGKDDASLNNAIIASNSTVALENVKVTQALYAIYADDKSQIKISKGEFNTQDTTIIAKNGSTISLKDANITSSNGIGLYAGKAHTHIGILPNNPPIAGISPIDIPPTIEITGGSVTGKINALLAEDGARITATDVKLSTNGGGTAATALHANSIIELHGNTTINNTFNGLGAAGGGKITSENLTITGIKNVNPAPNTEANIWKDDRSGVWNSGGEIELKGITKIENVDEGFYVDEGGKITSGDVEINGDISAEDTIGLSVFEEGSEVLLNGKITIKNVDTGLGVSENSIIKMTNSAINEKINKIESKQVALAAVNGGLINLANISATAGIAGIQLLALSNTDPEEQTDPQKYRNNEINLTNADVRIESGAGIFIGAFSKGDRDMQDPILGTVNLEKSEIHADVLLKDGLFIPKENLWGNKKPQENKKIKEISDGSFTLNADHSTLEGRAETTKDRNVHFNLNNTTWTLKTSKHEKDDGGNLLDIAQRARSDISVLNLNDSTLSFNGPTENHYHTLHIGAGKPDAKAVYNASGDAKIGFNIAWSDGAEIADQKTDRLLIHGDVSGTTTVYIKSDLGDKKSVVDASDPSNKGGLSLIQVSGEAKEDSFKLAKGYTTLGGAPYKYTLTAYGPTSSHGSADIAQNLFDEKNKNFWDFRLHKAFLDTSSGSGIVPALVPQVASYLVTPNALFTTGLTDMAKQNALLANIRTSLLRKEENKQTGFFLYTYASTGTLSSERGPLKYGYGADIRYAALQAGVTLAAIEEQNATTRFGLVGTYGQVSFTPKDMQDASKSTLDKWSLTAYGSVQHDNGFYIDTLLSYGIIKGDITNAIIGKTAQLKNAKMLSISTTVGKQFTTGVEGLTFEPQTQLAYQHLMFDTISDADNLTIDMNNPHQWLIRVGGRLTKTIVTAENGRSISLYGKVNAVKTFDDDEAIHINKNYQRDPLGSFIEGGLGISAQLSPNVSLHGDVSAQQKLQKTGITGASFSGGIRYQF